MLLALDKAVNSSDTSDPGAMGRINAIKMVIAQVWLAVGKVWECSDLVNLVNKVCRISLFLCTPCAERP
jgi:hypothetical protein